MNCYGLASDVCHFQTIFSSSRDSCSLFNSATDGTFHLAQYPALTSTCGVFVLPHPLASARVSDPACFVALIHGWTTSPCSTRAFNFSIISYLLALISFPDPLHPPLFLGLLSFSGGIKKKTRSSGGQQSKLPALQYVVSTLLLTSYVHNCTYIAA